MWPSACPLSPMPSTSSSVAAEHWIRADALVGGRTRTAKERAVRRHHESQAALSNGRQRDHLLACLSLPTQGWFTWAASCDAHRNLRLEVPLPQVRPWHYCPVSPRLPAIPASSVEFSRSHSCARPVDLPSHASSTAAALEGALVATADEGSLETSRSWMVDGFWPSRLDSTPFRFFRAPQEAGHDHE